MLCLKVSLCLSLPQSSIPMAGRWAGAPRGLPSLWVPRGQRAQQCTLAAPGTQGLLWSYGAVGGEDMARSVVGNSSEQRRGGLRLPGGGVQPEQHG